MLRINSASPCLSDILEYKWILAKAVSWLTLSTKSIAAASSICLYGVSLATGMALCA